MNLHSANMQKCWFSDADRSVDQCRLAWDTEKEKEVFKQFILSIVQNTAPKSVRKVTDSPRWGNPFAGPWEEKQEGTRKEKIQRPNMINFSLNPFSKFCNVNVINQRINKKMKRNARRGEGMDGEMEG